MINRHQPPAYKKLLWQEDFRDEKSVIDHGGIPSGNPTISNGVTLDGSTQLIDFGKVDWGDTEKIAFRWKGYIDYANSQQYAMALSATYNNAWAGLCMTINRSGTSTTQMIMNVSNGTATIAQAVFDVADKTLVDLVAIYNGSTFLVYKDGEYLANGSPTGVKTIPFISKGCTLRVGATYSGSYKFAGKTELVQVFSDLDGDDVKDLYDFATYTDIDDLRRHHTFRSWYWQDSESGLLTDWDMEASGTSAWSPRSGTTLTKITTNPISGTQSLRITGASGAGAYQGSISIGKRYRLQGKTRGDGSSGYPSIVNGTAIWNGTTSTTTQEFDLTFTAGSATLYFWLGGGGYVDFDDLVLTEYYAQTDNDGTDSEPLYLGDKTTTTSFPTFISPHGASFQADYMTEYPDFLNGITEFEVSFLAKLEKYSTLNYMFSRTQDSSHGIELYLHTGGSLIATIGDGSRLSNSITADQYLGRILPISFIYDGSKGATERVGIYIDGELAFNIANAPTALGTLTDQIFYWGSYRGNYPLYGFIYETIINDKALTPLQVRQRHHDLLNNLNI